METKTTNTKNSTRVMALINQIEACKGEIAELLKEMIMLSHTSVLSHKLYLDRYCNAWIFTDASDNSWQQADDGTIFLSLYSVYNSVGCQCDWCVAARNEGFDVTDYENDIVSEAYGYAAEQAIEIIHDAINYGYFFED